MLGMILMAAIGLTMFGSIIALFETTRHWIAGGRRGERKSKPSLTAAPGHRRLLALAAPLLGH